MNNYLRIPLRVGLSVALLAAPVAATTLRSRAAGAAVTNFTAPGISGPVGITTGADGALWFTNEPTNLIGRITTAGAVTTYAGTGISDARGPVLGPDGAVWFANIGTNSIGRISTAGVVTNYTGTGISIPDKLTVGSDGAIWFTNAGNPGSIGRITTAGVVSNFTDASFGSLGGITAGPDGALWFTHGSHNWIGRITTSGTVTNFTDATISSPQDIAVGSDGALWFTNFGNGGSIGRITTGGTVTNFTDPSISSPFAMTAGPDGALWFTNLGDYSIGRIATDGTVSNYRGYGMSAPEGITSGPDGALWFTNIGNDSIGRITTTPVPNAPTAVTVAARATKGATGELTVSYIAGDDAGLPITKFTATCTGRNGGVTQSADHAGATAGPTIVKGLTTGRTYACSVTATKSAGTGLVSVDSPHAIVGAPAAPKSITVARVKPHNFKVGMATVANNGSKITSYAATCTSSNGGVTRKGVHATKPVPVTKVSAGKTYTCTVRATNKRGAGPVSAPSRPAHG